MARSPKTTTLTLVSAAEGAVPALWRCADCVARQKPPEATDMPQEAATPHCAQVHESQPVFA